MPKKLDSKKIKNEKQIKSPACEKPKTTKKDEIGKSVPKTKNLSAIELAKVFKVSKWAVYKWAKDGCPKNSNKTYDLETVREWISKNKNHRDDSTAAKQNPVRIVVEGGELKIRGLVSGNNGNLSVTDAKNVFAALTAEVKLNALKGLYVLKADVESEQVAKIHAVKTGLTSIAQDAAQKLVGKNSEEISTYLINAFQGFCNQFATPIIKEDENRSDETFTLEAS